MKLYKKVLSALMSCAFIGATVISDGVPQTIAVDISDDSVADLYDNTESEESKEVSETNTTNTTEITTTTTTTTAKKTTTTTTTTTSTTSATSKATTTSTTTTSTTTTTTTSTQTTEPPFRVFDIYNAYMGYTTTTVTTLPENLDPALVQRQAKGIDVSAWQPNIDWKEVKEAGIEFAIMRAGYGKYISQKDPTFDYNMQEAQANGIACGAYWYSYATDVESAIQEAEVCYSIIKDYDFTYPVYFDIEDPSQDYLSTAQISAMTDAFCSTLASKGVRVGVYSYTTFLKTKIYAEVLEKYDVWVANFDVSAPSYSGDYGIWQYTASGYVDGVPGVVDLDVSYVNYPYIMSPDTYVDTPATSFDHTIKDITTTTTSNYLYKGIDVSVWQNDIDWNAVKESGEVDYAIIRAGYGKFVTQKDEKFDYNITTAQSLGIDCGAYWYSYATDVESAIEEAKAFCEVIKGYKFEYPVYFDIEDPCFDSLSNDEIRAITEAFCSYMEEQGYCCGVTSYSNFLRNKLGASFLSKYAVWIAHYNVRRPSYGGYYGMWQYTSTGTVDGINGTVDLDYAYVDYPALMIECHRNGY
ncbi:MAG: glycoside hydrolase family 25 protein [Ruminococcus flavefaciens]|nr:glycoside hydrolase family 25 protein [Ruminococcus flavefaciens]